MSYLIPEDFEDICNTVNIFPISSASIGDVDLLQWMLISSMILVHQYFMRKMDS